MVYIVPILFGCHAKKAVVEQVNDLAFRSDIVDEIHGEMVADPYRWMEDADSDAVKTWTAQRNSDFNQYTDALPQRQWIYDRFQQLWRYDDESVPSPCLLDPTKEVFWKKKMDQDKWVVYIRSEKEEKLLIDPNSWEETETMNEFTVSPDCTMAAYGKARAGDENPTIIVVNLETGDQLEDELRGWKQRGISWLHDNSGFYYSSWPLAEEAPNAEKDYYHRSWFHPLGTDGSEDSIVLEDTNTKEYFHGAGLNEEGNWIISGRYSFETSRVWIQTVGSEEKPIPLMDEMDAEYTVDIVGDTVFILTNWEAPNYRIMTASVEAPSRDNWTEFIPESEDIIRSYSAINGQIYVNLQHNATTNIHLYSMEGEKIHEMKLPTIGNARVSGILKGEDVYVHFSSFAFPSTTYTYDSSTNSLTVFKESPLDVDVSNISVEQVHYPSKDGTMVSMFIVKSKSAPMDGSTPMLLTGYGGFNISMMPRFSTLYTVWMEAGGAVAIPNLRGGGEYGQSWHEGGMRENKQNVFDDFIAAAEYLELKGYSHRERIAIAGGSNGGLLVSAVVSQRPELFKAVLCQVPLTDMIRYHQFGLANIWSEEYGNSEDPELFPYLLAYSPVHNVTKDVDYPAVLITGSENDARTDPVHARKMAAVLRWADKDHGTEESILLHIQSDSGHGGGVGIDTRADQYSRNYAFLMQQIGMVSPEKKNDSK